jgi:hypothetical protein
MTSDVNKWSGAMQHCDEEIVVIADRSTRPFLLRTPVRLAAQPGLLISFAMSGDHTRNGRKHV